MFPSGPEQQAQHRIRVFPAGPRPQSIFEDIADRMSDRMPDRMPERMEEKMPDRMPDKMSV